MKALGQNEFTHMTPTAVGAIVLALFAPALALGDHAPRGYIDCMFVPTVASKRINISIVNECGEHAKIRTCSTNFTQCVGYMSEKCYQDCPARIDNGTAVLVSFDNHRGYILIDCPAWWGPGIDNWWTIQPTSTGRYRSG